MTRPRILVAGVGNIFHGDDGFGVEVVRQLTGRVLPDGVRVTDFGIRGHDLAYAILDGYDGVILVDATHRNGAPGTLYTLEPDLAGLEQAVSVGTHDIDLPAVFQLVQTMGGTLPRLSLVGCEPGELGSDDEGTLGLSEPVKAAVDRAVLLVEAIIEQVR